MLFFEDCKHRRDRRKVERGLSFFLAGKYEKAAKLLKEREAFRYGGDVAAAQVLLEHPTSETIEQCRALYDGLWKAKCFSFDRDEIRQLAEEKLEAVTPVVMQAAQAAIDAMHRHYQNGDAEALFRACEEHVAYGHPDAVALQIWGEVEFGLERHPERALQYYSDYAYQGWFFQLNDAVKRGISDEFREHTQDVIRKLQVLLEPFIHTDPPPGDNLWELADFGGYGDY